MELWSSGRVSSGPKDHVHEDPPNHGFWNHPLSWALGPACRILMFMWSLGPQLVKVSETSWVVQGLRDR